ncbi:MAG TPA: serine/threonine-protein kinase [Dokdonella sp.]|uniref:serine/threonine-protein kinase n=1 Tax=Dokdonella sp. TaxID=2291710 RepID=UPI002D7F542B|nr:serine/threonine-protein kinase [Dokdonella sp.]HET9032605.1 serine/threonine-protein kinase [Dokdonella sp.]
MTPDQWSRTKALFGDLLDHDPSEWPELLSNEADPQVTSEVHRMLQANQSAEEFLSKSPAATLDAEDRLIGRLLGPFRIESLLGEGGAGRVYLAQRQDVGGNAAIKILRGHFAGPRALKRFYAEQAILARLDHPNIARLLQVGVTDDAVPWLAMEYVQGRPFSEVMAESSVRERVLMVIKLLDAIDYAHRQLIVHRDIKPGNILVDQRGEPRLLDFGIAKRLDDTDATRTHYQPRTPAYAAPEQVLGKPITVATDVYAMGVVLYEALSGNKPWNESGSKLDEAILAGDAALPSTVASRADRREISGDLDAIVMQAMHRDPRHRYPSAASMARDLQRALTRRPVSARKQTSLYRTSRFLARYHRWVASGLVLLALLSLGIHREVKLRQAALLEAQKSTEVADFMLDIFDAGNALSTDFVISKDSSVMDLIARGASRLDSLDSAPLVRADLAHKMGQVYWGFSEFGHAEHYFSSAIALREANHANPDDIAESYLMLGRVYSRTGRYAPMLKAMQKSWEIRQAAFGADDAKTIRSLHRVGVAYYFLDDLDHADSIFSKAIAASLKQLPESAIQLADSYTMHAFCQSAWGQFDEALETYREALKVRRSVLPANHNLIGEGLNNLAGGLFDLGRTEEAIRTEYEAFRIDKENFHGDHNDLVLDLVPLARYLIKDGQIENASRSADEAVAMATRLNQKSPNQGTLDRARQVKVEVLRAQGQLQAALDLQRDVLRTRLQNLPPSHTYIIGSRSVLADLLRRLGHSEDANQQLNRTLDGWRQNPDRYTRELIDSMQTFADAGQCDWLTANWSKKMSTPMADALARDRKICGR